MVGLLAATIGASIAAGTAEEEISSETRLLAVCSAASFALIDVVYACKGRIGKIYLADAAVELAFIFSLMRER